MASDLRSPPRGCLHLDESPELIGDVESALLLQTLEDRVYLPLLQMGQQIQSTHEVLASTLRWCVSPKHLRLTGFRTVLFNHDSVRVPPITLAATSRAPPVALLLPALGAVTVPRRDPPDEAQAGDGGSEGHTYDSVPPPCSRTAAMIRLKISVLLCMTFCTMFLR